jgi:hypothetical protein
MAGLMTVVMVVMMGGMIFGGRVDVSAAEAPLTGSLRHALPASERRPVTDDRGTLVACA